MDTQKEGSNKSFWMTLPGILAGIAAVITAIGGLSVLVTTLCNTGIICSNPTANPTPDEPQSTEDPLNVSDVWTSSGLIYPVVKNGFVEGATTFRDRDYTFTNIPDFLVNATYIMTANEDKFNADDEFLSFRIDRPASVYIAYNAAYPLRPDWLLSDFRKVSGSVKILNPDPNSPWRTISYELHVRDFNTGEVVLGGNFNPNDNYNGGMYSVILVSR